MVPAGHDETEAAASPTALVVPVGGTPEAPLAAIREVKPHFVAYVVSAQTRPLVDQIEAQLGTTTPKAREILLSDPQDLTITFREIQAKLPSILQEWNLGWDALCVDLTGGTKVMTAALALATIHRAHRYLYVGGAERTKEGVGTVVSGTERPIQQVNPWDVLAVDQLRRVAWAFNNGQFAAAVNLTRATIAKIEDVGLKTYLGALQTMIEGFQDWDRFSYKGAQDKLTKSRRILALAWPARQGHSLLPARLEGLSKVLQSLLDAQRDEAPSEALLKDLLANALRRAEMEQRADDAVARLYRFIEGLAQQVLFDRHGLRTASLPVEKLPESPEWQRARERAEKGAVKLGLEESCRLLRDLGDPVGQRLFDRVARGGDLHNWLQERNSSLLAHGTKPVAPKVFEGFFDACLALSGWTRDNLTAFLRLPEED
jgi:CRISPR-associated protein (TIGR02710 family)